MRRLVPVLLIAAALAVAAAPANAADYRGYVSVGRGPAHTGVQGNAWTLVFRETKPGRVSYRVCVGHLDRPRVRRCYDRRTSSRGRSSVFVALFVNDQGGTGRWRARWYVGGRSVDTWSFRVNPEFEGY
jgi:hypothetical protein